MKYWAVTAMSVLLGATVSVTARTEDEPPNHVQNPSFEQAAADTTLPLGWQGDPQVYSIDQAAGRSGTAALKYVNPDPKRYVLCTQKVPLQGGWKCRVSAWVKTSNVVGDESGATVCLEWGGQDGKWLGGVYPTGIKGDHDWQQIEAITRLPENATACNVACYVREGMTGTAWFDDVEVVRLLDPPMQTVLLEPVYRGRISGDGPETARVRVKLNRTDYDIKPEELCLTASLRQIAADKIVWESADLLTQQPADRFDVTVPSLGLETGQYDLALRLTDPAGKEMQVTHCVLTHRASDRQPKCVIDNNRRLLLDGKPFLPIGMYWGSINEPDIKIYADSAFNCLMPYGSPDRQQMDLAQQHGLKVIYSVKDWYAGLDSCPKSIQLEADEEPQVRARVREFRDHPALLAWYLNDELPQQYLPRLEAHYRWVAEEDVDHPTWVVLYQFNEVAAYLNTFDVIGTDPYPIGKSPASMAAAWTAETWRQVEQSRPMWQVPQLHNWANYATTDADRQRGRTPSVDEVRSMAWQCLCEGATGLVFYSWFDVRRNPDVPFEQQWAGLKQIAAEIDGLAPILLSVEPVQVVKVVGAEPQWIHFLARSHAGKLYVMVANDGDGEGNVAFALPGVPRTIRVLGEDRTITSDQSVFQDKFIRLAVHVYEITL